MGSLWASGRECIVLPIPNVQQENTTQPKNLTDIVKRLTYHNLYCTRLYPISQEQDRTTQAEQETEQTRLRKHCSLNYPSECPLLIKIPATMYQRPGALSHGVF